MNSPQGSRSFALASRFIPKRSRSRIFELYRWCRSCDDLIDEAPDQKSALERLRLLREGAGPPASKAPSWVLREHQREFFEGLSMDVEGVRYKDLLELEVYCFRVAGVVGLMMCPLLGASSIEANAPASALGKAMQLTNIARDVQADAILGRVYIPDDLLTGVSAEDLRREPERAHEAVQKLLVRADQWYAEGLDGLRWLPWWSAFGIAIAGRVYQEIGHKLLRNARVDPASAYRQRTVVSAPEKVLAVIHAFFLVLKVSRKAKKESVSLPGHELR